jgi:ring-1,2-phenylacetyl-CoA epoxidase subunit PaaD
MVTPGEIESRAWTLLGAVADPEIPVLSLIDLGVIRYVRASAAGPVAVGLAPTYSGCPATTAIRASVVRALEGAGIGPVRIVEELAPPWSSDWLSKQGRQKLERYGIAPPAESVSSPRDLWRAAPTVACPRCGARATTELSHFGSTPCKALYRCDACLEPFEYFKCI